MRRWHEERALMLRRWRMELGNHVGGFASDDSYAGQEWLAPPVLACGIKCHCARGIGTMRKQRPYDGWGGSWNAYEVQLENRRQRHDKRKAIQFELDAE
jgi:hypothetical protein